MSKIHGMMDTGRRTMQNSQTALQTVGHNIANKATEGYSRQRVETQAAEPLGLGKQRIGMGAKTAQVTRINNPYLERQIGKESSQLGFDEGRGEAMGRVEQVYNEQMNKGLNTFVSDFFNSFREFSNNPENLATRTQVKETAEYLTKDFKRMSGQLTGIQRDLDQQVATHVNEINNITKEIASLNEKIQQVTLQGGPANDERDRRDLLIKNLGDKINIRWAEGEDSTVTITAGNSALLVAGYDAKRLEARETPATDTKAEGNYDIFYYSNDKSSGTVVTDQLSGGKIGGLLDVRDKVINNLHDRVDGMAVGLAQSVNMIHSEGYDAHNRRAGDFFEVDENTTHAAEGLKLNEAIQRDVGNIAGGAEPFSPGDNRIANKIGQLQFHAMMDDGRSNLDEYYNSIVGEVGVQARRSDLQIQSQGDIVKNLKNIRESISGVSIDEETTKLIEFQKAFDASARLIKTADEMFDTVLNLKRM